MCFNLAWLASCQGLCAWRDLLSSLFMIQVSLFLIHDVTTSSITWIETWTFHTMPLVPQRPLWADILAYHTIQSLLTYGLVYMFCICCYREVYCTLPYLLMHYLPTLFWPAETVPCLNYLILSPSGEMGPADQVRPFLHALLNRYPFPQDGCCAHYLMEY